MLFFGKSDIGKTRETNQDAFFTKQICDNAVLCMVCDGMGGANGGNVASSMAITLFTDIITRKILSKVGEEDKVFIGEDEVKEIFIEAVSNANSGVYNEASVTQGLAGMGTTLVAALIVDKMLYAVNIGDSRLYYITKDEVNQITRDHSYVQQLIDSGVLTEGEAQNSPQKNIITRAVGTDKSTTADVFTLNLSEFDSGYLLLCSDGLSNYVTPEKIHRVLYPDEETWTLFQKKRNMKKKKKTQEPEEESAMALLSWKTQTLVEIANELGGTDNITAVLIEF